MFLSRHLVILLLLTNIWLSHAEKENANSKRFSFTSEDFDDPKWKGLEIFNSGPIINNKNSSNLDFVQDNPKAKKGQATKRTCSAHKLPSKCKLLHNCHVLCSISLLKTKGQMEIIFPCKKGPKLVIRVKVKINLSVKKVNKVYRLKIGKSPRGTLIPEFGYKFGNMQSQVKFAAIMKKRSNGKVAFKIFAITNGYIPGHSNYKFQTKFLEVRTNPLSNKCAKVQKKKNGKKTERYNNGPCSKLILPSICAITPDCMSIFCSLKFLGQEIMLSFRVNKCESPMTLSVQVKISTLHIDWSRKFKSGILLPIPGYAITTGGIDGGVLLEVDLKPKWGKLNLQIKLLVGVTVGFIHAYPIDFQLLKIRLPIKIKGCGKTSLGDNSHPTTKVSRIPTTIRQSTARPSKRPSPSEDPDPYKYIGEWEEKR